MDGIEAVGVQRVVKVDDVHLRLYVVAVVVVQQLVHHPPREVWILVVIDEHRVALLHHLAKERSVDAVGLTGAGRTDNHTAALRGHYVDVALVQFPFILVSHRNVHAVLVFDELLTLLERIPVIRQMGIETPYQSSQKDGSD